MRIEFLLEEYSMKIFLETFLPKILPDNLKLNENYFLRSHEGKSDLQKSIPKKIRAFNNFETPVGIIILQDQDSNNCLMLKNELNSLCSIQSSNVKFLIRIVCRELESWYLGDFNAIENAYPTFNSNRYKNKAKFRNPDECYASVELKKILPAFQKVEGARNIAPYITVENNKSTSFKHFVTGLIKFLETNFKEN